MNLEQKRAEAQRMRNDGATLAVIAKRFGVSPPTVMRWTDPAYHVADRQRSAAWKNAHRDANRARDRQYHREHPGTCSTCGDRSSHQYNKQCRGCYLAEQAEKTRLTAEKLVRLWAEGKVYAEICAEMGWTPDRLSLALGTFRARGYDLPYRRTGAALDNIRAGNAARWENRAA